MFKYKNVLETLVEERYDQLKGSLDCCTCEECRNDVIACALNLLPNKYVVTRQGELYTKLDLLDFQYKADIMSALVRAGDTVRKNPRHAGILDAPKDEPKNEP